MLIVTLKTDQPDAEIGVYEDAQQIESYTWLAHRQLAETLHTTLRVVLQRHGKELRDIAGIVVFRGPGSFTGLRIGISVANALAYSIPAAMVGSMGEKWIEEGIGRLGKGENQQTVLPEYGALPHITPQRK